MRIISKILLLMMSFGAFVSCVDLSSVYSRSAKGCDVHDATFVITNETGQEIIYRHVSYIGSFSLYSLPDERSVIECTIPSGKTEVVGYSYWKYNKISNANLETLFNSIYVGEIKADTEVTVLDKDRLVLASWKPGDEKEFNIFDAARWTGSKTVDGEYNHYNWSIVLNELSLK